MKILILSASTGGGHIKASKALQSYILNNDQNSTVEIVDTLEYISHFLNKTVTEGYLYLATKTPKMYGAVYKSSNKENKFNSLVVALNKQFSKKLIPLIDDFKPDVIVSTHPFVTEMLSGLKKSKTIDTPVICIMTDYAPHKTWICSNIDRYVVANEDMVESMVDMGVPEDLIYPFGIPIDDSFYNESNKDQILEELNLDPKLPTILIMAGSFGVTDILKIYNNITSIDLDFQIIVITGKNKKLYSEFEKLLNNHKRKFGHNYIFKGSLKKHKHINKIKKSVMKSIIKSKRNKFRKNTKLIFFTDQVYKYMHVSDLIITKPGGLTVSESLACNLPMALFNAIPGQEEENADFLIKNNMAVKIGKGSTCKETIRNLLINQNKLENMKTSCKNFDKSASNQNIFTLINDLINLKQL